MIQRIQHPDFQTAMQMTRVSYHHAIDNFNYGRAANIKKLALLGYYVYTDLAEGKAYIQSVLPPFGERQKQRQYKSTYALSNPLRFQYNEDCRSIEIGATHRELWAVEPNQQAKDLIEMILVESSVWAAGLNQ